VPGFLLRNIQPGNFWCGASAAAVLALTRRFLFLLARRIELDRFRHKLIAYRLKLSRDLAPRTRQPLTAVGGLDKIIFGLRHHVPFALSRICKSKGAQTRLQREKMTIIYKILPAATWAQAQKEGEFRGSEVDLRDGFIHFSTASQAVETAAKHFAGQHDLVLLYVDTASLGAGLKWEPSRGGALFPHLYGELALAAVTKAVALPLGPDGAHQFPTLID
jgi:uncharacterized protein (DUF952 family)